MNSLVVTDVERALLAVITAKRDLDPSGMEAAAQCAATLIGGYPDLKVQDPAVFVRHLAALLSDYPAWLLERAWIEIPRTIPKYKLDIAAAKEWLEERMREKRYAYGQALEAQRVAEKEAAERAHKEQVAKEDREFKAWLADHPGGTFRQWCGITPYVAPFQMGAEEEPDPVLMGPYPSAAHLVNKAVQDLEP